MPKRDEFGRLPLPDESKVPFQRVLSRVSYRRQRRRPAHQPSPPVPAATTTRRAPRPTASTATAAATGVGRLSLEKNRSRSLTEDDPRTKMPFIPFQRVQNIRKKTVIPVSNSNDFRVEPYRSPDRRRRFTHRDWLMNQPNNRFATEYKSRFQESSEERQRKATRRKNDSGQVDKLLINPAYDDKPKSGDNDARGGYHSDSGYSRTSYSRINSTGGSKRDDTAHDSDAGKTPSSGGSVKLPQIRDSPLTAPDSATSVAGKGAAAPPVIVGPGTSGDAPASATSRMSSPRARLQPQESSRWVEGKGSGCLRHFFPLFKPSAPKAELTTRTPATTSQPPDQHTSSSNQAPLRAGGSHATLTDPSRASRRPTSPASSPLQDSPALSKGPSSLARALPSSLLQASPLNQRADEPPYVNCFSIPVPPPLINASVLPVNGLFENTLNSQKDLSLTPNTLSPTVDTLTSPKEDPAASPVRASPFLGCSSPPPRKDFPHPSLEPPTDSSDSPPLALNSLPVQPGRPAADTARWVMGKGAGRLQGFAAKPARSHKKENSRRASLSSLPQSKKSSVKTKKKSRKSKKKRVGVVEMSRRSSLQRTQSDTALYLPPTHHNNYAHQTLKLKSNQVIIFRDRAASKSVTKGSRPSTPLPSIILTLPEAQHGSRRKDKQDNGSLVATKGKGNMTKVPSLPNIRSHYMAPRSFSSYRRDSTDRPTTPKTPRRRLSIASQNSNRQKSKPVISTLRRTATSQPKRHAAKSADTLNATNRQRFTKSSRASSRRRIPEQVHPEPPAPESDDPPTRLPSATSAATSAYIENLRKERQDRYAQLLASATGRANTPRPRGQSEDNLPPLSLGERAKTPTFSRSTLSVSLEHEHPGRSQDLALVHAEYVR
ncbi:hypothetical protein C7M84_014159 [Penaeus vannamei]|uniref:Uncharacterized protein n=1 Tax=Penaeus vannamei TaxID=6689 RepID=A0A423SU72_PENVA|nr:hypothetical protein C7M84_014159 [Penaeus vannamei]